MESTIAPRASHIVTEMVRVGAHASSSESSRQRGFRTDEPESLEALRCLEARALVRSRETAGGGSEWLLTESGVSAMHASSSLHTPTPVLEAPEDLPINDRSSYELAKTLKLDGWRWAEWVSESRRKKGATPPPIGYSPGGE